VLFNTITLEELLHSLHLVNGLGFNPVKVVPHIDVGSQYTAALIALGYLFS
jgi:hypothetical protein